MVMATLRQRITGATHRHRSHHDYFAFTIYGDDGVYKQGLETRTNLVRQGIIIKAIKLVFFISLHWPLVDANPTYPSMEIRMGREARQSHTVSMAPSFENKKKRHVDFKTWE